MALANFTSDLRESIRGESRLAMVGSVLWRIQNYGLVAALKYVFLQRGRPEQMHPHKLCLDLQGLIGLLALPPKNSSHVVERINSSMHRLRESQLNENLKGIKPVVAVGASITRLVVLDLVIAKIQPDLVIETGTQHGVSASVVSESISHQKLGVRFKSIDVANQALIRREDSVEYLVLDTPIRVQFRKETICDLGKRILFFHDSDHSYENMIFEFDWAWNYLKVKALVSDDIDGNYAFKNFCRRNNLTGYRVTLDDGPAVGLVIRD